jgi:hypothetical protein
MGIYQRADSKFWYVWLSTPGKKGRRLATKIPIDGGTPSQTAVNKQRAEEYHSHLVSERIKAEMEGRPQRVRYKAGTVRSAFSYIYFIEGAGGLIKIGRSLNVKQRLRMLQTGHPAPLKLLAFSVAHIGLERELQRYFAALLVNGEWYRPADNLMAFISRVQRQEHPLAVLLSVEDDYSDQQHR